jgi:hypothetical protein
MRYSNSCRGVICGVAIGLLGVGLGGCGDESNAVPLCESGTKKDCTLPDGSDGEQICNGGYWGSCTEKTCTDGSTMVCTQTDGKPGVKVCQGGKWTACGPDPGQCQDGTYKTCTTADGKNGTQLCTNGTWGACEPDQVPKCKDGDTQSCSTACGTGTEVCINETWQNCTAPQPQQEVCDGADNNCDGNVDEVCACVVGKCEACYTGPPDTQEVGQCKEGQRCCTKTGWGLCQNEVLPAAKEDCTDTIDNDCNGTVNDGCTCVVGAQQACGTDVGECIKGQQVCGIVAGEPVWGACLGGIQPVAEKLTGCDGKDNDCDGIIDNNLDPDTGEANNTCATARPYTVKETDLVATQVTNMTIYPQGDVDYYRITALEDGIIIFPSPCVPFSDEQCHYLEVEILQPAVSGLLYQFSLLTGMCALPAQTFTSTNKKTIVWEGICGLDDTRDFWLKVEPTATSAPNWSCKPYTLKLRYTKLNKKNKDDPCP